MRKPLLQASDQKFDPAIRSGDLDFLYEDGFPLPSDVYGMYSMISATTLRDLVTLTFNLDSVSILCLACPTHIPIFIVYGYRLPSCELLNLITFPLAVTVTAHASCRVIYHQGAK